jgi:hypothetical protein
LSGLLQKFGFIPLRFEFKPVTENWIGLPGGLTGLPQQFGFIPLEPRGGRFGGGSALAAADRAGVEWTRERRSEGGGLRPQGALWADILKPTSIGPTWALMGLPIFSFSYLI